MSASANQLLQRAIAEGIVPPDTPLPEQAARPWPVVLLTALGAWLAAIPLLAVVGLLLGDVLSRSGGPYLVGILLLAAALVVLRAREMPLFIEQLAVPALLVGGGSLGFGLFRDLHDSAAAAVLTLIALAFAFAISRQWLRVLLGATAAGLAAIALLPGRALMPGFVHGENWWLAAHAVFALWLAALWAQRKLAHGIAARQAAALEAIAAGWLLALLTSLALLSGMTFMVGASLGGGLAGEIAREAARPTAGLLLTRALPVLSVLLAAAAAMVVARAWPVLRRPVFGAAALILTALGWFLPALGAVLLALALMATSGRFLLCGAAAVAASWIIGSFYYQLHWDLATKAAVLVVAAALLGALAWLVHGGSETAGRRTPGAGARVGGREVLIALAAVATLAVANVAIWQKETLIAHGRPVFVELAPVDPRSLMQGDYMRLNFRLPPDVEQQFKSLPTSRRPQVVARIDERGVAHIRRVYRGAPLAEGEIRIELVPKNGRWVFVTDAWFFREGDAKRWEAARYGEFRVDKHGKALLVGMADAQLKRIEPGH